MTTAGPNAGNLERWSVRVMRAGWRLLPHASLLLLLTSWSSLYLASVVTLIAGVVGTLGLLAFVAKPAGAPNAAESKARIARFLLDGRTRSVAGLLFVALGAASLLFGSVTLVNSMPDNGPVVILAVREGTADSTGVALGPDVPQRTWFTRATLSGIAYTLRRGGQTRQHTIRAWAPRTVRYPEEFTGPIRVYGLLGPDLTGSPVYSKTRIRITSGAKGDTLGEGEVSSLGPRAFVLSAQQPSPADAADSVRWVAVFDSVVGSHHPLHESAAQMWLRREVVWFRARTPLAVGDSITITVSRLPHGRLVEKHLKIQERTTDVLLTRTP